MKFALVLLFVGAVAALLKTSPTAPGSRTLQVRLLRLGVVVATLVLILVIRF